MFRDFGDGSIYFPIPTVQQCLDENLRPDSGTIPTLDYPSDSEEEDDEWIATLTSHLNYTTMDSAISALRTVNTPVGATTEDKSRFKGGKRPVKAVMGLKVPSQARSLRKRPCARSYTRS